MNDLYLDALPFGPARAATPLGHMAVVLPYRVKQEPVQSPGPTPSGLVAMQQPHQLLSSTAGLPVTLRDILPFS